MNQQGAPAPDKDESHQQSGPDRPTSVRGCAPTEDRSEQGSQREGKYDYSVVGVQPGRIETYRQQAKPTATHQPYSQADGAHVNTSTTARVENYTPCQGPR